MTSERVEKFVTYVLTNSRKKELFYSFHFCENNSILKSPPYISGVCSFQQTTNFLCYARNTNIWHIGLIILYPIIILSLLDFNPFVEKTSWTNLNPVNKCDHPVRIPSKWVHQKGHDRSAYNIEDVLDADIICK